jgi:transposase, IS5 family
MAHRRIGQDVFRFGGKAERQTRLDELGALINLPVADRVLARLFPATKGEKAWRPLAMFKALLLATWYDFSDVALGEALADRAGFRHFCAFPCDEATPEHTAFVRFLRLLVARGLDRSLSAAIARDLESKGASVRKGTLIDATVIGGASKGEKEAAWVRHRTRPSARGLGLVKERLEVHLAVIADNFQRYRRLQTV